MWRISFSGNKYWHFQIVLRQYYRGVRKNLEGSPARGTPGNDLLVTTPLVSLFFHKDYPSIHISLVETTVGV